MDLLQRAREMWWGRHPRRHALALAGGGVVGGMYEVGALAALEQRLAGGGRPFDIYVGCSAGSVVASLLASGIRANEIYDVLDRDLPDTLNFRRGAVYAPDSLVRAGARLARLAWAVGKQAISGRGCLPDMLALAERELPAGFFSLDALEAYLREALAARGLPNAFADLGPTLLVPAVDLDRAERVVFGRDPLREVPISQAVAASSAIPGFFEPYTIGGRAYVDGGVGWSGHADLAAEAGADVVFVVNPLVPALAPDAARSLRARGLYTILEQAGRIYSRNLLQLGLAGLATRWPGTQFFLLEPPAGDDRLFGPSMGFEAARAALRYGYASTVEWLNGQGAALLRRLVLQPAA